MQKLSWNRIFRQIQLTNRCYSYYTCKIVSKSMKPFKLFDNELSLNTISSGFPELDNIIGGWQRGNLIMIAAPSRMGKTAFALSMLRHYLLLENKSGIWFSS